jgi:protein-S-isoprenylcysteine O-methyltransferase Ste14
MNPPQKIFSARVVLQLLIVLVLIPFLPLLITGRWNWWEAWGYAIISILGFVASRALALRRHPDLLSERTFSLQHENIRPWDKLLAPMVALGGGLIPLAAGLDAFSELSPIFSPGVKILALGLILAGYSLGSYALIENRFFSGVVRIQTERGHQVVSSGPYRWMRHPGYSGALITFLATPVLLDSLWAFLPAGLVAIILVLRTYLEDQFLQAELSGYRDYASRVRYRLLPGIW